MDPELEELLARIQAAYARHGGGAAQDVTRIENVGQPPQERPTLRELISGGLNFLGEQTLGRGLALLTMDPRLPQTQEAYRRHIGFVADLTPVVGDIKAIAYDAPELFATGHPIAGSIAAASAIAPPLDVIRKTGLVRAGAEAVEQAVMTGARAARADLPQPSQLGEALPVRHHSPKASQIDILDPEMQGTGKPGAERRRQAASEEGEYLPRTFFYGPRAQTEPQFRRTPEIQLDLDRGTIAPPDQLDAFWQQARAELTEESIAPVSPHLENRAEQILRDQGFEGYEAPNGFIVKFTPTTVPVGATGSGVRAVQRAANSYVESARARGLDLQAHPEQFKYLPVPEAEGKAIADMYDQMPHDPTNPAVAASYDAFATETLDQYRHLVDNEGVEFIPTVDDPYANSTEMIQDVRENKRLRFFLTEPGSLPADHPMAQPTGVMATMPDGTQQEMVYNDLFRAVHDYFGHASEGFQFGPRGEHNAWGLHSVMYSPLARGAMSFETRGQNSWVNYGSHIRRQDGYVPQRGDPDFISPADRPFAEQKANILPPSLSQPPVPIESLGDEAPDMGALLQELGGETPTPLTPSPDELFSRGSQSVEEFLGDLASGGRRLPERPRTAAQAARARLRHDARNQANRAARRQAIEAGLTPEELASFAGGNKRLQEEVEKAYSLLPTPETFAHAAIRGQAARGWYQGSGAAIREAFGDDAARFTALLAAQSPQKSVEENLRIALNSWGNWVQAGRPQNSEAIRALMDTTLEADLGNSVRALMAAAEVAEKGDPGLLNGPKVGPFYANLLGQVSPVVNDTHMARGYGTLPGRVGTKGRNLAQNAMLRNAAKEFERITGQAVDPRELQEMSWAYIRGLTNAAGDKGKALDAIEQSFLEPSAVFAGGQTLTERIEDSASIGHLMAQPEFAESLARAGVQAPTPRSPVGVPGLDPQSADIQALRDIAERIDLVRAGKPLYSVAPVAGLLGLASARQRLEQERQNRR